QIYFYYRITSQIKRPSACLANWITNNEFDKLPMLPCRDKQDKTSRFSRQRCHAVNPDSTNGQKLTGAMSAHFVV
ncbi:MAG TPA: hypothetical protein VIM41_16650, partial [Gammaproteobacteria bacterium]